MARYIVAVPTPLSPAAAYAYMADITHFAEWDPGVTRAVLVSGTSGEPGARYDVDVKNAGRMMTLPYEIVEGDPPDRLVIRADTTLLRSVDEVRVEAADAGALVTYDAQLLLKGPLRLLDPLMAFLFRRIGDRAASGLRRVLAAGERSAS